MTSENTPDLGVPTVSPSLAIPHGERAAGQTNGLQVRTSKSATSYAVVRQGTGWPAPRGTEPETESVQAGDCACDAAPHGGGGGIAPPRCSVQSYAQRRDLDRSLGPDGTRLESLASDFSSTPTRRCCDCPRCSKERGTGVGLRDQRLSMHVTQLHAALLGLATMVRAEYPPTTP